VKAFFRHYVDAFPDTTVVMDFQQIGAATVSQPEGQ